MKYKNSAVPTALSFSYILFTERRKKLFVCMNIYLYLCIKIICTRVCRATDVPPCAFRGNGRVGWRCRVCGVWVLARAFGLRMYRIHCVWSGARVSKSMLLWTGFFTNMCFLSTLLRLWFSRSLVCGRSCITICCRVWWGWP